jgi:hypothetical protein
VQDGLLPLKQTVRHLLEPRITFLVRRPGLANGFGCIQTLDVGSRRFPTVLAVAGIVLASLVPAAIVAGLGPSGQVVCGTGHVLDRIAQAITQPLGAGHIDGSAASNCVVPSTNAWFMAAIAFAALTGGSLVAMVRPRRPR